MNNSLLVIGVLCLQFGVGAFGADTGQRAPVPDAKSQSAADASIKDLFKSEYKQHAPADRLLFVSKLMKLAQESRADPSVEFVALREAEDQATIAGDVNATMAATDATASAFEVKADDSKLAAIIRLAPNVKSPAGNFLLAYEAADLCDGARSIGQVDAASRALAVAASAAERSRDGDLISRTKLLRAGIDQVNRQRVKYEQALKVLEKTPQDADANLAVGKYLCFTTDQWEKGLPYLGRAREDELQSIATLEAAPPRETPQMKDLAERWWQWSGKTDVAKADAFSARSRAAYWYGRALPELKGLEKSAIMARIAKAADSSTSGGPPRRTDLMRFIDPARDTVAGAWELNGHTLITTDRGEYSRIRIECQLPGEYDFVMRFIRIEGSEGIAQIESTENHTFVWLMGGFQNRIFGFGRLAGKGVQENPTTVNIEAAISNGVRHTSIVRVRRRSVDAYLDGALISRCKTPAELAMDPDWDLGNGKLGIGTWGSRIEFYDLELVDAPHDEHKSVESGK